MIPFIGDVQNRQIHGDRKTRGCPELGKGAWGGVTANRSGVPFETAENVLKLDSGNGV